MSQIPQKIFSLFGGKPSTSLARRAFIIAVFAGLGSRCFQDLSQYINHINLNQVLGRLSTNFKQDLLSNPNNLPKNLSRLLEFLTNEKIKTPNQFLINAKNKINESEYQFHNREMLDDYYVDFEKKIIYLNSKNLLDEKIDDETKLKNVLMALFSICGLINLNREYQKNDPMNKISNQVLCQLISQNVVNGISLYNFDEIQCSKQYELKTSPESNLAKLLDKINAVFRQDVRELVIEKMRYLNIDNRTNGPLNTY